MRIRCWERECFLYYVGLRQVVLVGVVVVVVIAGFVAIAGAGADIPQVASNQKAAADNRAPMKSTS